MGLFGPYCFKSKHPVQKGKKWYIHSKVGKKGAKIYYLSKDKKECENDLPAGLEVFESEKTGLPMLRKKTKGFMGMPIANQKDKGTSVEELEKQAAEAGQ